MNIILKRQVSQNLLGIYLPSLFIMIIAQVPTSCGKYNYINPSVIQATLYFSKEHFKTSIPVSITAMLVMYTLNNSVASKLPQTSKLKFIDIWIIHGLFVHFIIIILLVLIEHLPGTEARNHVFVENQNQVKLPRQNLSAKDVTKHFAQKVLPFFEILFIVFYFVCALIIYN